MDQPLQALYRKFQQLNIYHMFLSDKGYIITTSMICKLDITESELHFYQGLELIELKQDEIHFLSLNILKRKRDYKQQVILARNELFVQKCSNSNMDTKLFIEATIQKGDNRVFQTDFMINTVDQSMHKVLEEIKAQKFCKQQILAVKEIKESKAVHGECILHPKVEKMLHSNGIQKLYQHQIDAIESIRKNTCTVVSTRTASGKSLIFQIPTIEMLLDHPDSTFLYLFVTKALSNDQFKNLSEMLLKINHSVPIHTYDGDTPTEDRANIRDTVQILFTNPDMLHCSILPNHSKWRRFLVNLRYIVIDECHVYDGLFGAHFSMIIKRLQRICAFYSTKPLFLGFSATIGNPQEHFSNLIQLQSNSIDTDASPCYARQLVLWNDYNPILQATHLAIFFARRSIKCLVFTLFRHHTEQLLHSINTTLKEQGHGKYSNLFKSYRGGYQANLRRSIESEFKSGSVSCVVSTNALELGIDIGTIDVVLHLGFPGSNSYKQQFGRAGRKREAMSIMITNADNPIDAYWIKNPTELFNLKSPKLVLNIPPILQYSHAACASAEIPLSVQDYNNFITEPDDAFSQLLIRDSNLFYYNRNHYTTTPHVQLHIRGELQDIVKVFLKRTNVVLEEIELERAFFTLYPGCVFMHQGLPYLIDTVDIDNKEAYVYKSNVDFYTRIDDIVDIDPYGQDKVELTCKLFGYSRYNLRTNGLIEKVEREPQILKRFLNGCWLIIPPHIAQKVNIKDDLLIYSAQHAVNHCILSLLPMNIKDDIGCECRGENAIRTRPTQLMFYERHFTGHSSKIRQEFLLLLHQVESLLQKCDCSLGCLNCIHTRKCRTRNGSLDKQGAMHLCTLLIQYLERQ